MAFLSDLITSDDEKSGNKSILVEPLSYQSNRLDRVFTVPIGFVTDLASIPRLFQLFISKMGRHRKAAVLHDYLYSENTAYLKVSREQADIVFYDAMRDEDVPLWKSWSMYRAVRLGGWASFRKTKG
jgi:hypothetical protein